MKEFEKYWEELQKKDYYTGASDRDKIRWGYTYALRWVLSRVPFANSDGSIIIDIEKELLGEQSDDQS